MHWLVVVIAFSLAFYGVKGGIFVLTGAAEATCAARRLLHRGPQLIGLALLMTVPLLWYIRLQLKVAWQRLGLLAMSVLTPDRRDRHAFARCMVGLGAMGCSSCSRRATGSGS